MTDAPAAIPVLSGLRDLTAPYDGLILDLWGVIHDGHAAYPGVADALERLRDAGKKVVMLSNAPRRAEAVAAAMAEMGIGRDLYTGVLTSGELAWQALHDRREPWAAALGRRCLHVGPPRDKGLLDGLDLTRIGDPECGAFLLNTGPWEDDERVEDYETLLQSAAGLGMAMVCANPDLEVLRGGTRIICAGALALRYEAIGGTVHYFGKPYAEAYVACLRLMGMSDRRRLLAIGDSLATDIRGAGAAGLDAVLVTSGIHADELGLAWGESPDPVRLAALCRGAAGEPLAAIPAFRW